MKKLILGLFSVLFIFASIKVIAEIMSISRFGGLNTDDDPLVLAEDRTPDSENVVTDEGSGLKPRGGFIFFSTEPSRGLWSFYTSDGSKYLITQSSNVLKATLGDTAFTIRIGTVNPNVNTSVSALGDKLFYTNTEDALHIWDTVTSSIVTGNYKAAYCASHKGRLWLAGVDGDERTIYGSKYIDGGTFALATYPVDTDPLRIQVQGALDDILTGLFATYNDMLIWYKKKSFGAIYGSRRSNFGSMEYSNSVGCSYIDSVQNCDGKLRWLGNDKRIYEFNGESYYQINNDIETLMDTVEQGDINNRNWIQTSAADWNSGTIGTGLDTTTVSGDVIFTTITSQSNTYFIGSSTYSTADTTFTYVVPDTVAFITFDVYGGVGAGDHTANRGYGAKVNVPYVKVTKGTTYYICLNADGGTGGGGNGGGSSDIRFDGIGLSDRVIVAGGGGSLGSACVFYAGGAGGFNGLQDVYGGGTGGTQSSGGTGASGIDGGGNGENGVLGFGGNGGATAGGGGCRGSGGGGGGGFYGGGGGGGSGSLSTPPNGGGGGSSTSTYSNTTFITGGSTEQKIILNFYSNIYNSTYTSKVYEAGERFSEWGLFQRTETLNDGTIIYSIFTDTDTTIDINDSSTYKAKQTITDGTKPTIEINPYITVSASFARALSTHTPTLHDFTVNFNEGSSIQTYSAWLNQRYWLGVAISSTANNKVLVYDRKNQWQRYSGINISAMTDYSGRTYFGNNDGIYIADYGTSDNETAISAYYKTKDYLLTNPDTYKQLDYLQLVSMNSNSTLQTKYYIDQYATEYSLDDYLMTSDLGLQNSRLPFAMDEMQQGKTVTFKFLVSSIYNWRILNFNLYYQSDIEPDE